MKNFKSKMTQLFNATKMNTSAKKIVVVLLATVMLLSVLPLQNIGVKGAGENVTNYPLFEEVATSTGPAKNSNWSYGIKDYSERAELSVSTTDFDAPTAAWNAGDLVATLGWNVVTDAVKYQLKIFKGTGLVKNVELTDTTWVSGYGALEGGVAYQIQVTAFNAEGAPIAVSDVCQFIADEAQTPTSYPYVDEAPVYYANKYVKTSKQYYNGTLGKTFYYKFALTSKKERNLQIRSIASAATQYGAYLVFTAPEDGKYDYSAGLTVVDTTATEGIIKSRILKIDEYGNQTVVWPYDSNLEWGETHINSTTPEPVGEIGAPQVELKAGEKLITQAYLDCEVTSSQKTADISFANPTITKNSVDAVYKEGITSYNYGAYAPQYVFGNTDSDSITSWVQYNARWSSEVIKVTNGVVSNTYAYDEFNPKNGVETLTATVKNSKNKATDVGYAYYTRKAPLAGVEGALILGGTNHGVSYDFESPAAGTSLISAIVVGNEDCPLNYRLLKNGVQIFPQTVGGMANWQKIDEAEKTNISISFDIDKGDKVSLQFYCDADTAFNYNIYSMPSITLYGTDVANKPGDDIFSPLWERPFEGKTDAEYDFIPIAGNTWEFNILNSPNSTREYISSVNKYTTADKYLYAKGENKLSGYVFDDSQLKFKIGTESAGMSLTFVAPVSAYYNFSTALNQIGNADGIYFRFLKNSSKLWPKEDEWAEFSAKEGDMPAQETLLVAGESVTLQLYADLKEPENEGDDMTVEVGLGTLVVHKLNHKQGDTLYYEPSAFKVFEEGYDGEYINLQGRFNYSFLDTQSADIPIVKSTSASSTLFADASNFITLTDKPLALTAQAGNTTVVEYVPNTTAEAAEIHLQEESITPNTMMCIEQGDSVLLNWTDTIPPLTNISVNKGEGIVFKFRNIGDYSATFSEFFIQIEAEAASDDITENTTYYAIKSNVSANDLYTGKYKHPVSSFWYYDLYESANDNIVASNYYLAQAIPRVYNTDLNNIGYYFEGTSLGVEIEKSATAANGFALGFEAPNDNSYNFKTGLMLTTENATATVKARLLLFKADGSAAEKIWPAGDTEWFEQEMETGDSIKVPYINLSLKDGDKLYFIAYASESDTDFLKFNLASPAVEISTASSYLETDTQSLSYYDAVYGLPYSAVVNYDGAYVPMIGRWNFEYVNGENAYVSDYYKKDSSSATLSNSTLLGQPSYSFGITSKNVEFRYIFGKTADEDIGSRISFYIPENGTYMLNAQLNPTVLPKNMTASGIKYRIVKRDASTGQETQVWPKNQNEEYEILTKVNWKSGCLKLSLEGNIGDEYILESSVEMSEDDRNAYFTTNSSKTFGEMKATAPISLIKVYVPESAVSFDWKNSLKDKADDAVWSAQYTLYADNPDWRHCTESAIGDYNTGDNDYRVIGISNAGRMIIQNRENNFYKVENAKPAVAYLFTVPRNGFIKMASSCEAKLLGFLDDDVRAWIRITQNGEKVWPAEDSWYEVSLSETVSFKDLEIEVAAGDEIRFEATTSICAPEGDSTARYITWNPVFRLTETGAYYNITDDIYSYLDKDMTTYFKALTPATFAENDAAGKIMSEQAAKRKEAAAAAGPYVPSTNSGSNSNNSVEEQIVTTTTTIYTPGDYTEWTEEIYTPGEKIKHTYTKVIGTNWLPIIIIICVVAALLALVIVLFILQKKGKIHLFQKKKAVE